MRETPPGYLSIQDMMRLTGCSYPTVLDWITYGRIPATRKLVGRKWHVKADDFRAFIDEPDNMSKK